MVRLPVLSLCSLHASLTFNKVNSLLLIKSGVKVTSGGDSGGLGDSRGAASPLSFFISLASSLSFTMNAAFNRGDTNLLATEASVRSEFWRDFHVW